MERILLFVSILSGEIGECVSSASLFVISMKSLEIFNPKIGSASNVWRIEKFVFNQKLSLAEFFIKAIYPEQIFVKDDLLKKLNIVFVSLRNVESLNKLVKICF